MDKFCVFCGQRPESKNREHVIPKWLIELTGNPNRTVYLGRDWTSPDLKERKFALNSFTFPACEACNSRFSALESRAQSIVGAILAHKRLGAEDWSALLDWLDKVRTGLWLGQIYLNRNYRGIDPVFHIQNRIGAKDRLAVIYALREDGHTGVAWSATDTPLFQSMPSCFTLAINTFLFVSVSSDFLFSERIGFPYPCKREMRPQGGYWLEMARGSQQHLLPLVERQIPAGGVFLLQPMIPWEHFRTPKATWRTNPASMTTTSSAPTAWTMLQAEAMSSAKNEASLSSTPTSPRWSGYRRSLCPEARCFIELA